jgi:DNA polymerase iota
LQLISEAKELVPDLVIVLGEDLNRFRDASKTLYKYLESFTWSGKVERLGFDEVFLDVTDLITFNRELLNFNDLEHSFFQLKVDDPIVGFSFDASIFAGHTFPPTPRMNPELVSLSGGPEDVDLLLRLMLGSHLAQHLRWSLEEQKGYTSTVGISTNKLLSKLVGNLNKPKGQTTLVPPYSSNEPGQSSITRFLDDHDIGKIPGVGFKMAQCIRNHILSRPAEFDKGLIYGGTLEDIVVRDVRLFQGMGPGLLEHILGGPGSEKGIGGKIWGLINGIDPIEVQQMKKVPTQISIEDSYIRLDTIPQAYKELHLLTTSLLKRMHVDLLEDEEESSTTPPTKRWIAKPRTIRLSTRPRPPPDPDGSRARTFNRISKSIPLPTFACSLKEDIETIVTRLVQQTLIPLFRQLHPQPSGWNLSLVNVCVTNMLETASEDAKGSGRDISRMFKNQEHVLKEWKVEDRDVPPDLPVAKEMEEKQEQELGKPLSDQNASDPGAGQEDDVIMEGSEDTFILSQISNDEQWDEDGDDEGSWERCEECGASMPAFAMAAHERFHTLKD